MATRTSNGSDGDTQTQIGLSATGDIVVIPNGSWVWSTGITCSKAIKIMGASIGGVTITDNMSGTLVSLTPTVAGVLEFCNINFSQGTVGAKNNQHYIAVNNVSGNPVFAIHDCDFFSTGSILSQIIISQNGGVIWNCTFDSGYVEGSNISIDESIQCKFAGQTPGSDTRYMSASTMGTLDVNGTLNTYIEDCTFQRSALESVDIDDGSRTVWRHCTFDNTSINSHGFDTSPLGNRHWEIYNNTFIFTSTGNAVNLNGFLQLRGGTGVIANNVLPPINSQAWGAKPSVKFAALVASGATNGSGVSCPTSYPLPRQIGQGWTGGGGSFSYPQWSAGGSGYILDPVYIWGNTGGGNYSAGNPPGYFDEQPDTCGHGGSAAFIHFGRDVILDTVKSGYATFSYPHPLIATLSGGGDVTPPTAVSITAPSAGTVSGTISVTATASDNVGVFGVQMKLDGVSLGAEDLASPYTTSWNTTTASNGSHTLTAVARDAAGNSTTSTGVVVTVSNGGGDVTPPTGVAITSPTSGATVSGTINVTATASDNVGVVGVQLKVDNVNTSTEDTTPPSPFTISWNTTASSNGVHLLTVLARDAAGNTTLSSQVSVTVSNGGFAGHNYTTTFPAPPSPENPISEGGVWISGSPAAHTSPVRTSTNFAFGTQSGTDPTPNQFFDSTAVLTGTWGPDQTAQASVVLNGQSNASGVFEEVEIRLRTTIGASSTTGYEMNLSANQTGGNGSQPYMQIGRWNGPIGSFFLVDSRAVPTFPTGSIFKAQVTGGLSTTATITVSLLSSTGTVIFSYSAQDGPSTGSLQNAFTNGSPGIGFYFQSSSTLGINNTYGFSNFTATDGTVSDTTPPVAPVPAGLSAVAVSSSQINLSWNAYTDPPNSPSTISYPIEHLGGGIVSFTQFTVNPAGDTTASDTGLTASTAYTYRLRGRDAAGNTSTSYSANFGTTTQAGSDITPPTAPSTPALTVLSSSSIRLDMSTASTDNITGQASLTYHVERRIGAAAFSGVDYDTFPGTVSPLTYTDSGCAPSTSYGYRVRASDAANNLGPYATSTANVTTLAAVPSPVFVQSNDTVAPGLSMVSCSFDSAQTAGNFNVIVISSISASSPNANTISTIVDQAGNNYVLLNGPTTIGTVRQWIYGASI